MAITTVHNELIAVNAISGTAIADNAVTSVHIAKNNVGTVQIAQNSVTSVSIALNNVTGTQIAMNSITSTQLADNAVTATKIPDGTQLALGATNFSGSVGIGTSSPARELHVSKASSGATSTSNSVLVVEDDDNTELSILGGSSSVLAINFGHSGDADDAIISYNTTSGSENMGFTVSAAERMRIAGNNLFLNGGTDARIQLGTGGAGANSTSNDTVHIRGDGDNMKLMVAANGNYIFENNGTEQLRVDTSGNLQIVGGNQMTQGLFFYNGGDGHLLSGIRNKSHSSYNDSGGLEFLTSGTSNAAESVKMAIDTQGTTTIGRTITTTYNNDSGYPLHIQASGGSQTYLSISVPGANSGDTGVVIGHDGTGTRIINREDDPIIFHRASGETMRIDSSGRLLVGLTASIAHANLDDLQVGNGSSSNGITVYSGTGEYGSVSFADGTSGTAQYSGLIEYYHADNSMRFYANGTQHMKLNVHGQLIFTEKMSMMGADPASDIACHAGADGGTSTKWRWGANSNNTHSYWLNHNNAGVYMTSGSTGWTAHSDERVKENIEDIGSVLDKVKDYRCVKYNRKGDSGNTKIGFIAQDWETDFPQIIDEDTGFTIQSDGTLLGINEEGNTSTNKPKGLCYEETIPVLLKAIQELKAEVDKLKG